MKDFTAEGAEYSYQAWSPKDAGAPELKVFLNQGQANFKEPEECASKLTFAVGTSISRLAAGDFNDDSELDLALFSAKIAHPPCCEIVSINLLTILSSIF